MKKWVLCLLTIGALVALGTLASTSSVGVANAHDEGGLMARHLHMGGQNHGCKDCHDGVRADKPEPLKGKYVHMGGSARPDRDCTDCHYEGGKADVLWFPQGYTKCVKCHY